MGDISEPNPFLIEDMVINYTPILYNPNVDFTEVSNVLLVDTDVQDYKKFVEGCNSSTFPIVFSRSSNRGDIADLLASKLPTISRIAIVANNSSISTNNKPLFNYKPYFLESDLVQGATSYSENLQFLIYLINTHSVKNIDYLACYSLNYDSWKGYYGVLTKETGVTVGASSDETGNLKYGGDWVMESTGVDVEAIYFSESISGYQGTLVNTTINTSCSLYMNGENVAYSTDGGTTKTEITSWPCTLSGTITVTIAEDLTVSNWYFIISNDGGNNVTLEGGNHTVTVNGVTGYQGLVQSRSTATNIQNLGVLTSGSSTLAGNAGWVGWSDNSTTFSFYGSISNCYSTGNISGENSGGIAGIFAGSNSVCNINNCYSTGDISGFNSGGIVGVLAGFKTGNCTISNCYTTGAISGIGSGGIAGGSTGNSGSCTITNCYSTGAIGGDSSGGIAGVIAGFGGGSCTITDCYSTGAIGGDNSGGIAGRNAGLNSGTCTINNCYSNGAIGGTYSGGIAGGSAGNSGTCTITNCYSTGAIGGTYSGGIAGYGAGLNSGTCTINNCYTTGAISGSGSGIAGTGSVVIVTSSDHTDGWSDTTANLALQNPSNGSKWKLIFPNTHWKLAIFLQDANYIYDNGTLTYSNNYSISAYSNALNVTLLNNGSTYGSATVTLSQNSVTLNSVNGVNNGLPTYLVLYNDSTLVDYVDIMDITASTTTSTTTNTTTNPIIRVTKVTLNKKTIIIKTKATYRLIATVSPTNAADKRVRWFSSNTKIAKVNSSGLVTAVSPGKTTIVVTTVDGGYRASSIITVVQPVTSVKLNLSSSTIKVNSSKKLIATILPTNATNKRITWSSSNSKVATVDSSGLVKAKNIAGTATITAKTVDGNYKANATIKVTRTVKDILLATNINNSTVEFSIDADYNTLLNVDTALEAYSLALIDQIVAKTDISIDDIEILNISSGSIVNEISIPTEYVAGLQYVVQSGNFEITIDGVTYPAIASSFIIIDNICFHKGTMILTPSGHRAIETINSGDFVTTAQGRIVKVRKVTSFIGTTEKCPLYVLHKDSLGTNMPLTDLYMSEGHAYRHNGQWCHMKCSSAAMKLDLDDIEYYNIVLDNYLDNTLVANGVEVESLFNMKGLEMTWNCGTDNCKPVIAVKKQM